MSAPSAPLIRRAAAADAPTLGRLGATLMRLHHSFDSARFMAAPANAENGYAQFLTSQLEEPDVLVLVAEKEGRVVGYCYAALEPRSWKELRDAAGFIHDVIVDESCRGAGVGSALMKATMHWMKERRTRRVVLSTAQANPAAQRLFAQLGFRPTMIEMTRELEPS
jgi:ribosomal protein S18 acetylase RimI-like enzyme